jgi:hypothetical protein
MCSNRPQHTTSRARHLGRPPLPLPFPLSSGAAQFAFLGSSGQGRSFISFLCLQVGGQFGTTASARADPAFLMIPRNTALIPIEKERSLSSTERLVGSLVTFGHAEATFFPAPQATLGVRTYGRACLVNGDMPIIWRRQMPRATTPFNMAVTTFGSEDDLLPEQLPSAHDMYKATNYSRSLTRAIALLPSAKPWLHPWVRSLACSTRHRQP